MRAIVSSSDRGNIVYDGCMGSGSTAIAAAINGRSFKGCEIDLKIFNDADVRIKRYLEQSTMF